MRGGGAVGVVGFAGFHPLVLSKGLQFKCYTCWFNRFDGLGAGFGLFSGLSCKGACWLGGIAGGKAFKGNEKCLNCLLVRKMVEFSGINCVFMCFKLPLRRK